MSDGSSKCNNLMSTVDTPDTLQTQRSFDHTKSFLNTVLLSSRAGKVVVMSLSVSSVMMVTIILSFIILLYLSSCICWAWSHQSFLVLCSFLVWIGLLTLQNYSFWHAFLTPHESTTTAAHIKWRYNLKMQNKQKNIWDAGAHNLLTHCPESMLLWFSVC